MSLGPLNLEAPPLMAAPERPEDWPAWRNELNRWRAEAREQLGYSDAAYRQPAAGWATQSFACGFILMYDQQFYDAAGGGYRLDELLRESAEAFGGFDAVVLWHAYPRIGFDDRNQFDFYRDMPGGLAGLRQACGALQARGLRVFINYNPWDTGTRREAAADTDALADMVRALGADGIFLDTMTQGSAELRMKLDAIRPGVILESEGALPLARVADHHMSWAQNFTDSQTPGVLRNKYFERRHMQHSISRWRRDHTDELHTAWMNGSGMLVWENVFGTWVGWSARDRGLLRAMLPIQRRFASLFAGEGWTPLTPTLCAEVFASRWDGDGLQLWTLVNRSERWVRGSLLAVDPMQGVRYFDLIAGREIERADQAGQAHLPGALGPRGIGALLAARPDAAPPDLDVFLAEQAKVHARASFETSFPMRQATRKAAPATPHVARDRVPAGMAAIPAARVELSTVLRVRECGFYEPQTTEVYDRPYLHTHKTLHQDVSLSAYAMDLTPVTNAQYARFLAASGYAPAEQHNFLRHWAAGRPPHGAEDHPVVYVDLDDARAYARWAGKRLPTEAEWQYAAQGPEGLRYPWGDAPQPGMSNPGGSTTPVWAHPGGRSPWGCWDMCGNVWQWTESEHSDGRTRFCMLRGGSFYRAAGSDWYADGGLQPGNFAAKFLLMWPGLDRCATIGFRCAMDLT